eukprot:TRINITY_DN26994_c0_g4_i2.p1 TRINITY_DN26994_c0_g4~~TRINITY_DN26994_c0_g4_i2.p1  ORF type:complete len:499 (+),score=89.25 TRINITY_DN26994_c0_g4_i2:95-1591(+)
MVAASSNGCRRQSAGRSAVAPTIDARDAHSSFPVLPEVLVAVDTKPLIGFLELFSLKAPSNSEVYEARCADIEKHLARLEKEAQCTASKISAAEVRADKADTAVTGVKEKAVALANKVEEWVQVVLRANEEASQARLAATSVEAAMRILDSRVDDVTHGVTALGRQLTGDTERSQRLVAEAEERMTNMFSSRSQLDLLRDQLMNKAERVDLDRWMAESEKSYQVVSRDLSDARSTQSLLESTCATFRSRFADLVEELDRLRATQKQQHFALAELAEGIADHETQACETTQVPTSTTCLACYRPRSPSPTTGTSLGFDGKLYGNMEAPSSAPCSRPGSARQGRHGPCATNGLPPAPLVSSALGPSIPTLTRGVPAVSVTTGQLEALGPFEQHLLQQQLQQQGRDAQFSHQQPEQKQQDSSWRQKASRRPASASDGTRRRAAPACVRTLRNIIASRHDSAPSQRCSRNNSNIGVYTIAASAAAAAGAAAAVGAAESAATT